VRNLDSIFFQSRGQKKFPTYRLWTLWLDKLISNKMTAFVITHQNIKAEQIRGFISLCAHIESLKSNPR